jgi:hypothetical protein
MAKYGARGVDYVVALELLARAQWEPSREVRLGNQTLKAQGVNRQAKKRALARMQRSGLVSIEAAPWKSPLVRVRFVE